MEFNIFVIITGIVAAFLIFINPFIGLLITIALMPQAVIQTLGGTFLGIFTSVTPIKVIGGITFISAFIRYGGDKKVWLAFKKPQIIFFLLFVLWIFISGFTQPGFVTRENFTMFMSFVILAFITISLINSHKRFRIVMWVSLVTISIVALMAVLTYFGMSVGGMTVRISGVGYGPNEFAIGLLPFIAIAFYNTFAEKPKILKLVSIIVVILALCALIFTFSRGSIIGFLVMIFIAVLRAKNKLVALVLVLVSIVLLVNFMPSYIWERVTETKTTLENLDETTNVDSTKRRYLLAKAAWEMFLDYPAFGVGIGNYYYKCREYENITPGRTHDMYLEIMAELGIVGIVLFLGIIWHTLRSLGKIMKTGPPASAYACGLEVGLWGFLIAALFLHAEQEKVLWFIIFMTVVLAGISTLESSHEKHK